MKNSDFRRLLAEGPGKKKEVKKETEEERREREGRRKAKKQASYKRWQERKAQLEAKYAKSNYRDRAKERREDKSKQDAADAELKKYEGMSVEKTKFLGGDVEHTHLVKGLDYALLQRYKEELEREETEKIEMAYEEMYHQNLKKKKKKNKAKMEEEEERAKNKLKFGTVWGRSIYNALESRGMLRERSNRQENTNFIPGRMTFEFDIDPQFGSELPTTIIHSRENAQEIEESVTGFVQTKIANRISRIMAFLREGSKTLKSSKKGSIGRTLSNRIAAGKEKLLGISKKKKKSMTKNSSSSSSSSGEKGVPGMKMASHAATGAADDDGDMDIFDEDDDSYIPTVNNAPKSATYFSRSKQQQEEEAEKASYAPPPSAADDAMRRKKRTLRVTAADDDDDDAMDDDDDDDDAPRPMEGPSLPPKHLKEPPRETLMSSFSSDTYGTLKQEKKKGGLRGLSSLGMTDAYMECYPATLDMVALAPDENGKKGKTVIDDIDDPDDEGVGMSRRQGSQRRWGSKQRDEQREARELDKELREIHKIMKEKHPKKPKAPSAKRQKILRGFVKK